MWYARCINRVSRYWTSEGYDSLIINLAQRMLNTGLCHNALSQSTMCTVSRSTCRLTLTQWAIFYNFWNRIFSTKCEAIPDSSWQTGTYDREASFHQTKSEFASHNCQVISFSKLPSFSRFAMVLARCYNGWNLNTCSLRNV